MRILIIATGAVLLAGCGGSGKETAKDETASALQAGEYKLGWSELTLGLAEKGGDEPAAAAFPASTCIAEGGRIEPAAFADKGDACHSVNTYVRNGRINVQLSCTREGVGKLSQIVSGTFTADAFEAKVETTTDFESAVDYTMTGKVTGKRVGDCAPATEETEES